MAIRNVQHGSLLHVVPDGGRGGFRDTDVRKASFDFFREQLQRKAGP